MNKTRFFTTFLLLLLVQICIANFFRLSQYVTLSILPAIQPGIPVIGRVQHVGGISRMKKAGTR